MRIGIGSRQKTLKERVSLSGVGVHSGQTTRMTLCPAEPGSGIGFRVRGRSPSKIPALRSAVTTTELSTVLGDANGRTVATVEHLLAALYGLGIDNAAIEVDGPEVPVMDGSAAPFVAAIDQAGIAVQSAPKEFIEIRRPVRVELGSGYAEFRPYKGTRFEIGIAYDCPFIGSQAVAIDLSPKRFRSEVARARTFGHMRDVERLWAAGYALGSSLDNSVVIGDAGVVNPEGLRFPDEFARHKLLDAIGDVALAGAPLRGLYRSFKGGHRLNSMAVEALLLQKDAWALVSDAPERAPRVTSGSEILSGILGPTLVPEAS